MINKILPIIAMVPAVALFFISLSCIFFTEIGQAILLFIGIVVSVGATVAAFQWGIDKLNN